MLKGSPEYLVVDDDRGSCLVMQKMLRTLGVKCDVAHSFADGINAVLAKRYNFILMDCFLPDLDGWSASRAIKSLPMQDGAHPRIVGILSNENEELRSKCEGAGMEGVLVKPVQKADLTACMSRIVCATQETPFYSSEISANCSDTRSEEFLTSLEMDGDSIPGLKALNSKNQEKSTLTSKRQKLDTLPHLALDLKLKETEPWSIGELNSCCTAESAQPHP
jgi:CheY-like chemotaxis protein